MGTLIRCPRFIFRNIVLHLLAFAVVVFALQAKLSLYKPAPEPGLAAAKLSTDKNSAKVSSAIGKLERTKAPADCSIVALQILAHRQETTATLSVHSAWLSLIASDRLQHQGISRLRRPPPTLA